MESSGQQVYTNGLKVYFYLVQVNLCIFSLSRTPFPILAVSSLLMKGCSLGSEVHSLVGRSFDRFSRNCTPPYSRGTAGCHSFGRLPPSARRSRIVHLGRLLQLPPG